MTELKVLQQINESLQCIVFLLFMLVGMYFLGWNKK